MKRAGLDLDVDYTFSPWEEASEEIEAGIGLDEREFLEQVDFVLSWPKDPTFEELQARFDHMQEDDYEGVLELARPFNEELRQVGVEWATQLELLVREKWSRGDFIKAPFSTIGVQQERGFYSASHAGRGWSTQIVLKEEECPDMVALMNRMNALIDRRNSEIFRYLRR